MLITSTEWGKYTVDNEVVAIKDIAVIDGVLAKWTERKEFEEITGRWHVLCPEMVERAIVENLMFLLSVTVITGAEMSG